LESQGESAVLPKEKEQKEHSMAAPKLSRYNDIVPAKSVIGRTIVNANYQDLGTIEDLVLDAGAGRIAYAVLSFGGFLGVGDKYFAVPWYAFQFHLTEKRIVLNVPNSRPGCPN
jgi:sporulation protein YlmC with PRC-barrel domain